MSAPVKKCGVTPLKARCEVCLDTANKSQQMDGWLDCTACDAVERRLALRNYLGGLSPYMDAEQRAWAAYNFGIRRAAPVVPVAAQPVVQQEPVAYMAFAENGNVRIWAGKNNLGAKEAAEAEGLVLQPVYAAPSLEAQPAETIKYGCHIDLPEGHHDNCVLDGGNRDDCSYARLHGEEGRKKCGEWKPIKIVKSQPAGEVEKLEQVCEAVLCYFDALTARQHGGAAQDKAFSKIQDALGLYWQFGVDHRATAQGEKNEHN